MKTVTVNTGHGWGISVSEKLYIFLIEEGIVDKFLSEVVHDVEDLDNESLSEYLTIGEAFDWGDTDDGSEYWSSLSQQFDEYLENLKNPNRFKEVL